MKLARERVIDSAKRRLYFERDEIESCCDRKQPIESWLKRDSSKAKRGLEMKNFCQIPQTVCKIGKYGLNIDGKLYIILYEMLLVKSNTDYAKEPE